MKISSDENAWKKLAKSINKDERNTWLSWWWLSAARSKFFTTPKKEPIKKLFILPPSGYHPILTSIFKIEKFLLFFYSNAVSLFYLTTYLTIFQISLSYLPTSPYLPYPTHCPIYHFTPTSNQPFIVEMKNFPLVSFYVHYKLSTEWKIRETKRKSRKKIKS